MATNEIEIEVVLNAKEAQDGLAALEEGGEALGETFSGVGASISAIGGEMNERMGAVGETFGGVADSVMNLGAAVKGSQTSFLSLIGPIGLVTVALIEAYNAIESFFGTSKEREIKLKAYEISVAELTIILEELAAAQVTLTESQIEEMRVMSQSAKEKIEEAQLIREATVAIQEQIIKIDQRIARGRERLKQTREQVSANKQLAMGQAFMNQGALQFNQSIPRLMERRAKLQAKISKENARANKLVAEGARGMAKVEAVKEGHEKRGVKAMAERAKLETNMLTEARIKELQSQEQTEKTKTEIAKLEAQRRFRDLAQTQDVSQEVIGRAASAELEALKYKLKQIAEEEAKARRLKAKQAAAMRKMEAAKRLAEEQQTQAELARIRRAEIEHMRATGASQIEVLEQQQALELELAGNNARAREAITLEFENRRLAIQEEAERKRQEAARKAAEEEKQRDALRFDSMRFDLEMMRDGLDKEVALLELRYRREIELTATTEEEKVELQRRAEIERAKIIEEGMTNQLNAIAETTSALGAGFAESAYGALFMGESFKKSIGQIIIGLGKQATVESLMELAKGTAALFLNPAVAGQHFAASAMFATAAGVAGSVGSALGGGGGGGGGSAPTSPTGSPQSAPAPERERAESTAMVFNINFGNSTIYDTKRAAQDAMASEILRTLNRQRRGAPRFAMG